MADVIKPAEASKAVKLKLKEGRESVSVNFGGGFTVTNADLNGPKADRFISAMKKAKMFDKLVEQA